MPKLVAFAIPGGSGFVEALQRAWDAGDAVLPVDLRLPVAAQQALLERLGADEVVTPDGIESLAGGCSLEAGDALVIATSGTTGEPKGVIHTHASIRASAEITSEALGVTPEDHWLACLPLAHIGGFSVISRALLTDTSLTVLPSFDADAVTHSEATLVSLVNTALQRINPSQFRKILLGGAAPLAGRPNNAVATYGMTETGSGVVYDGWPLRDVEVRVDDEGQLLLKTPTLFRAYTTGEVPNEWFATGDSGAVGDDGHIQVFGRMANVINTGGEKVWPEVVERVLNTHPSIDAALVFGEPDGEWGQRVAAHVESNQDLALGDIRDWVKQSLPAYCAPKALRIVESLPRTASGKLRRA